MEYKSHSVIFFIFIRSYFPFPFGHISHFHSVIFPVSIRSDFPFPFGRISRFHSVGFSIRPRELSGEMALQEVEHLTVELMAVEVLVIDIAAPS